MKIYRRLPFGLVFLLSAPVLAEVHATAKAKHGGEYVLLTAECESNGQQAYVYLNDGSTEEGCWTADTRTVTVVWEQTGKRRYPKAHFRLTKQSLEVQRTVTVTVPREW